MKRILFGAVAVVLISGICVTAGAQAEPSSLGDYARSVKKNKPQETKATAKVYDNDNLPSSPAISVVGSSDAAGSSSNQNPGATGNTSQTAATNSKSAGTDSAPKIKAGESMDDRKKAVNAWKDKIDEQKKKIDQLAHDVDDFQHSGSMPTTAVWPYNQKYQEGLTEKQKALDQARADLSALQDQARKAGAPNGVIE